MQTSPIYNNIIDPEYSDGDSDDDQQPETISAKGGVKGGKKRKGHSTNKNKDTSINNQENDDSNEPSTVIYLGHLPQGFEEREITVFLNQFGNVSKCEYICVCFKFVFTLYVISHNFII